jgi:hypothetical protein
MSRTFQLGGTDALALWGASASDSDDWLAFGVGDAPSETVWRVDLPDDSDAADAILARADADLRVSDAALAAAKVRMAAFDLNAADDELSFSAANTDVLSAADAELRALLLDPPAVVSFGIGDTVAAAWESAVARFEELSASVRDAVGRPSRIETRIGGRMIAVTRVSLTGDVRTVWASLRASDLRHHARSVQLALGSRAILLRTITVTLGGAAGLAATIARPDGLIRAVPAALRFIETVRAQWGQAGESR